MSHADEVPPASPDDPSLEAVRRKALIFDTLLDAVVITDMEGRITDWNRAAERLYGYPRAQVLGRRSVDVLHPSAGMVMHEEILRALSSVGRWEGEVGFVRSDGSEGFTETVVIAHRDENGSLASQVGVNRDITERKLAEAALRRSEEQLLQAQKMEAVGRLAGGIAHDFNNLLAAIRGNAELALLELPPSSPGRTELEQIRQATDSAAAVARQLLSFSRMHTVQGVIDLAGAIDGLGRLLQRLLGSDVELVTRVDPDVGHVRLDPAQLEQILSNLTVNARDAMPGGGRLTIEARPVSLGLHDAARPSHLPPGAYVILTVADTGAGIDAEVRQRIFEPFFTTRKDAAGLGLFSVYGLVSQSGGSIAVESAAGLGTTFTILLPRAEAARVERRIGARTAAGPAGGETVLLVEDEPSVRMMAHRLLQRRGYRVVVAEDGEEALRLQAEHDGSIDVLLTDMTMPRMSGLELAKRMASLRPRLPIVFMSGYTEDPVPTGRIGDSLTAFIQKPFSLDVLARAVRDALDRRTG